jgi:cyanate lyase
VDRLEAGLAVDAARKAAGLRWQELADLLDRSLVWTTSALLGQQPISAEQATLLGDKLDLGLDVIAALSLPPVRGAHVVDTSEPVIYRLQEAIQVYGPALKALIAEEFGDGIMSAIDFELTMTRKPDPKGDRVVLTFDGKFLAYRVW